MGRHIPPSSFPQKRESSFFFAGFTKSQIVPVDRREMNMMAIELVAPPPSHGAERILNLDQAHIQRSRIVDKFAEAERHVLQLLQVAGHHLPATAHLSQKLTALKALLDQDRRVVRAARVRGTVERLERLSRMRAELVHSTLTIAEVEGEMVAVLRGAAEQVRAEGVRRLLTARQLKGCQDQINQVAHSLGQAAQWLGRTGFPLSRE